MNRDVLFFFLEKLTVIQLCSMRMNVGYLKKLKVLY